MTKKRIFLYLGAIILLAVLLRIPSLIVGFVNIDENEYALAGRIINQGGIPYRDFLIYQPPLIYYLYALTFKLIPTLEIVDGMWWVHAMMLLIVSATCLAIYAVGRRVFSSPVPALFAALFYAVFSTTFLPQDMLAANIELVMVLPMTLAVLFFLKEKYAIAGLWVGLCILTKYQGGILLPIFAVYLFYKQRWRGWKGLISVTLASSVPVFLWMLYLYKHQALPDAAHCFKYILSYAKGPPQSDGLYVTLKLIQRTFLLAISSFGLWYFACKALKSPWKDYTVLFVLWVFFGFIPVVAGGRLYFHYYIILYPPLALLAGDKVGEFFERVKQMPFEKGAWRLTLFILMIFIPVTGFTAYATYKPFRPKSKDYWIYVVDYIRDRSKLTDPIFVWGYCPQIYTASNRPPASRFITADYLTGRSPKTAGLEYDPKTLQPPSVWTKLKNDFITPQNTIEYDTSDNIFPGSLDLLMADFAKSPPEMIVDTSPSNYRMYGRYPLGKFPVLNDYVEKNYVFEATIRGMDIYRRKKSKIATPASSGSR
ncbi:MAG: glycosyltransferase family 39 protein [Deltaproteobacteria bacterium]|nr:glycosyltransferase family 39 protein [Deltaproteobacteria bacterium]